MKTNKLILSVGIAALSMVAFAAPKTYDVVFSKAVQAGTTELAPGEYKVALEGTNAIFTPAHTHNSLTVPVKVESSNQKYVANAIDTIKAGNKLQLKSIGLGGSKTKIEFGQ